MLNASYKMLHILCQSVLGNSFVDNEEDEDEAVPGTPPQKKVLQKQRGFTKEGVLQKNYKVSRPIKMCDCI